MTGGWQTYSGELLDDGRVRVRRKVHQWRWRFGVFLASILLGDRDWGSIRFGLLAAAVALFVLFGWVTESFTPRPWVESLAANSIPSLRPIVSWLAGFVDTVFTRQTLRHALLPLAGYALAVLVGARFINDLFELRDFELAREYLTAALFGNRYPRLVVRDCKIDPADADNPLVRVGGPGFVYIGVGLAAVCEKVGAPADVLGTGLHFLRRFETLREVFDLRDQFRTVPELKAMTKDGIMITARDISLSFRLRTGNNRVRTEHDPFPFSIASLRRAAYNRVVGRDGPTPWVDSIAGAIAGQIRGMIARRRIDDLIGPNAAEVRAEMLAEFNKAASRRKFSEMGAEVLWVSLGHFETSYQVAAQRIRTWQADWQRLSKLAEAEAQAEKLKMEETVRGEAVVQLISAIDQGAEFRPELGMTSADQFFVLLAETLEAYARRSALTGKNDPEAMRLARELRSIPAAAARSSPTLDAGALESLIY